MPVNGEIDKQRGVDALVSITQLAERLDQGHLNSPGELSRSIGGLPSS